MTEAQRKILQRAAINDDGARVRGSGKYKCCRSIQEKGWGEFLVGGEGQMARLLITPAGRAALAISSTGLGAPHE